MIPDESEGFENTDEFIKTELMKCGMFTDENVGPVVKLVRELTEKGATKTPLTNGDYLTAAHMICSWHFSDVTSEQIDDCLKKLFVRP